MATKLEKVQKAQKQERFQIIGTIGSEMANGYDLEGMKVTANIAGTKKNLGSTNTDDEGHFALEFAYKEPVDVNISVRPDLERGTSEFVPKASYKIEKKAWGAEQPHRVEILDFEIPSSLRHLWMKICKTYLVYGLVMQGIPDVDNPGSYLDLIPIPGATVHIDDVNIPHLPWPGLFYRQKIGTTTTNEDGTFSFEFEWCYQWPPNLYRPEKWDPKPDLLFSVTQTVNGVDVPIYTEDPGAQTRWDTEETPALGVWLVTESDTVVLPDDPFDPLLSDFEFHGVGRVLVSQITDGYATTSGPGDVVHAKDSPFGSALDIKAQFNDSFIGRYYQVLYAKWVDNATAPDTATDFTPILDESWPIAQKVGADWVTVQKSPATLPGDIEGCYEIPDYSDLFTTSKELLLRWRTHRKAYGAQRYPDGKYSLMVKVFEADGTDITPAGISGTVLTAQIDNTWPVAKIKEDIRIINGTTPICTESDPDDAICDSPAVCGIVYIESGAPSKAIQFRLDATDEQNHFRNYLLRYRTGHASTVTIEGKSFDDLPRRDHGYAYQAADWVIDGLSQCGYEVQLLVWDRTINGYNHIHRAEDFVHLILLKEPTP